MEFEKEGHILIIIPKDYEVAVSALFLTPNLQRICHSLGSISNLAQFAANHV